MARSIARPLKSYLAKNTRHSFWALRSSEIFSNVDFSPRYLRGPRPNIFFYKHSGDHCQSNICVVVDARPCQHLCAGIALYFEMNLPQQTGQMSEVTQGRSDGRTGVLTDQAGLTPSAYHSEKLLLGSQRSISTTLRDSFPSAPHRSFLLKERELSSSNFNIV